MPRLIGAEHDDPPPFDGDREAAGQLLNINTVRNDGTVTIPKTNFGEALAALKRGHKVARVEWDGKRGRGPAWWLELSHNYARTPTIMQTMEDESEPWEIRQEDLLAEDWVKVIK